MTLARYGVQRWHFLDHFDDQPSNFVFLFSQNGPVLVVAMLQASHKAGFTLAWGSSQKCEKRQEMTFDRIQKMSPDFVMTNGDSINNSHNEIQVRAILGDSCGCDMFVANVWLVCHCLPFWSVHGLHQVLGFALPPSCRGLGQTLRTDGYHNIFRLVNQKNVWGFAHLLCLVWPGQLMKGREKSTGFW